MAELPWPRPDTPRPGQESVWRYPRPAIAEPTARHLRIVHKGILVADTVRAIRTLETSHPPTYYFPADDVAASHLRPAAERSLCEWKGAARYFNVVVEEVALPSAAWSYPSPSKALAMLKDYVAFYAEPFELCTVDGERVTPQPGGFYGGWITSREVGPFKGAPGSRLW